MYPGTRDFDMAVEAGWLDGEFYCERDFQELKTTFDASDEDTAYFRDWFSKNKGLKESYREGVAEYAAVAARLGDHHAAHMDLGGAYYREGNLDAAETHVQKALDLGYPLVGLGLNYLACIAARRGQLDRAGELLGEAERRDPRHWVLLRNQQAFRQWLARPASERGRPPEPIAGHEFQLLGRDRAADACRDRSADDFSPCGSRRSRRRRGPSGTSVRSDPTPKAAGGRSVGVCSRGGAAALTSSSPRRRPYRRHLMPQPTLGFCSAAGARSDATASMASRRSFPVTGLPFEGRLSSS